MYKTILSFSIIALLVISAACSNSTSSDDHDHEHMDAEGFRLKLNGQVVVEQLPGEDLTGEIELEPNQESDLYSIFFLDDDGDEFQPEDEDYSLGYKFSTEDLVEFEQHSEDGRWRFHLHTGDSEGHADLNLILDHGDHSHFTSKDIEIHVHAHDD